MRLRIDTTDVEFRVAAMPRPRPDFRDKSQQATTRDGRKIWSVRMTAFDKGPSTTETIWVEVAGDQPSLVPNEIATVTGMTFAPWVSVKVVNGKPKGEIMRNFRAESITQESGTSRRAA